LDEPIPLGLELIRAAIEEQHPEDEALELRGVQLAPEEIVGTEEVAFELRKSERHGPHS
jgi:hypothetical protein